MNFFSKQMIQRFIALLIVLMMTLTNFIIIGANTISYATQDESEKVATSIELNKEALISSVENTDIVLTTTLFTSDETMQLYKNPTLRIELPKEVSVVKNVDVKIINGLGLKFNDYSIKDYDGKKVILVSIDGEQVDYSGEIIQGTKIQVKFDCNLKNKFIGDKESKIEVKVHNENTGDFINNQVPIKIINPESFVVINTIDGNENIRFNSNEKEKSSKIDMYFFNNENSSISNVNITGEFPTNNTKNNMGITLKGVININKKAKTYYTENENATDDLNNSENKWQEKFSLKAKKYLIVLDKLKQEETVKASYDINLPANLKEKLYAEESCKAKYLVDKSSFQKETDNVTRKIEINNEINLIQNVTASVGGEKLEDNAEVKSGEIIKYSILLKNTNNTDSNGINVNAIIPDGTTQVEFKEVENKNADMMLDNGKRPTYLDFVETSNKKVEFKNINIESGKSKKIDFYVKVNNNIENEKKTTCTITTTYNNKKIENAVNHTLENAEIALDLDILTKNNRVVQAGYNYDYQLRIINNSDKDMENVKLKIDTNELLNVIEIVYLDEEGNFISNNSSELNIKKIKAKETKEVKISTLVKDVENNITDTSIRASLIDNENNTYKSNLIEEKIEAVRLKLNVKSLTNSKNKKFVTSKNIIKYIIEAKNIGNINAKYFMIKDKISDYLKIKSVRLNGKEIKYKKSSIDENNQSFTVVEINKGLNVNEKVKIEILTEVNTISSENILKVDNIVSAYNDILITEAQSDTYIINGIENTIETPNNKDSVFTVTGTVWKDNNKDGSKNIDEEKLKSIKVHLFSLSKKDIVSTVETDEQGAYSFNNIKIGRYIVLFEYDTNQYEPTAFKASNVLDDVNSDVIQGKIKINNEEKLYGYTEAFDITTDISDLNLGLIEKEKFDIELNTFINEITVNKNNKSKSYKVKNKRTANIKMWPNDLNNSLITISYTIQIKNNGNIPGYLKEIVDYKANDLEFDNNSNSEWYQFDNNLYNESLAKDEIKPGETRELKLVLNRKMTETDFGVLKNIVKISKSYNYKGLGLIQGMNLEDTKGIAEVEIKKQSIITYILITIILLLVVGGTIFIYRKKIGIQKN